MARPRVPRAPKATPLPLHKSDVGLYLGVTAVLAIVLAIVSMFFDYHCHSTGAGHYECAAALPIWQLILGSVILEASGLIAIALKNHQGPAWFGFTKAPLKLSVKLILGGVAVIASAEALTALLGHFIPFFTKAEFNFEPNLPALSLFQFALLAVLIAPPLEEFVFRGIFFRAIWSKTGPVVAAVISSLIFTAAHGLSGATLALFVFGLYLCYMYKRSGSIIPGIILHAANNLFAVILLSFGVR